MGAPLNSEDAVGRGFTMEAADDIPFNNVNYYLENGFIVVSLEYRLQPQSVPVPRVPRRQRLTPRVPVA